MSNQTLSISDSVYKYILQHSLREHAQLVELRQLTAKHEWARMQIAPEQGQLMALLVELTGAKNIVEVGTFTGYSALAMALALPADGKIICCDISKEWTDIGKPFWKQAGVEALIDLRIAPALDTLNKLIEQHRGNFDMAFIDADKSNYLNYYERCLELLRPGGLIMFDNTLWDGDVADSAINDEDTIAIRALNDQLHKDERVSVSLVPIGDGLTLARKRE